MTLVNKIRAILGSIDDIKTVMYDSGWSANVRIDRKPAPYALLYLLSDWSIDVSKGYSKEAADLQVFFFDNAKFDATGEEKDIVVEEMEAIAKEFILRVLHDKDIKIIGDSLKLRSSYGQFDKFCVGVSVTLKIEEKQGSCLLEPITPTPDPEPNEDEWAEIP